MMQRKFTNFSLVWSLGASSVAVMQNMNRGSGGSRFPLNQTVGVLDPIRAFKEVDNEEGTYTILHAGQNHVATAARGQSLERLVPVGPRVPTFAQPGASQELYWVTKISHERLTIGEESQQQQQQQSFSTQRA